MILVDTSVWIEVFRKPRGLDLEAIVDLGDIARAAALMRDSRPS